MKKLLISLLLLNIFILDINAETYSNSYSISLSYNVYPTYKIKLPKTIDISDEETNFEYFVCGDIYADQTLEVLFDSQTQISSFDKTCNVYISQSKTNFTCNELTNSYTKYIGTITHEELSSGTWNGQLNVVISLIGGLNKCQ